MTTFFWSDLHHGHIRLAEMWRPWAGGDVQAHGETLRAAWCSRVTDEDTVVLLGDVLMGKKADSAPWLTALPFKRLVWLGGNHDTHARSYGHRTEEKRMNATAKMADLLGDHRIELRADPLIDGEEFGLPGTILSHFPFAGTPDHSPERSLIDNYGPDRARHGSKVLIHGHTHSPNLFTEGGRMVHVGVDALREGPMDLETLRMNVEHARHAS